MPDMLAAIAIGAVGGAIYGLTGFFKNRKQNNMFDGFQYGNFFVTVAGSAVIGGAAVQIGLAPSELAAGPYGVAITQVLRHIWKTFMSKK